MPPDDKERDAAPEPVRPTLVPGSMGAHGPPSDPLRGVRRTLRAGEVPATTVLCLHGLECAGCPLIQSDYASQLQHKRSRVVNAVARFPGLELVYTQPVNAADPIVGYRGRAKLILAPRQAAKGGGAVIGLYGRSGNHDVVDIPSCKVLAPVLADVVSRLRELVAANDPSVAPILLPYDPLGGGVLRAVDLREVVLPETSRFVDAASIAALGDERTGVLLTLVLQRDRAGSRDELVAAAKLLRPMLPRVLGLAANFHDADAPQILGSETMLLDGAALAEDRIGAAYHVATYGSFVQAHRGQAARIHQLLAHEVRALDTDEKTEGPKPLAVLDLYAGSGAISIALAHAGFHVTMVESFAPAAENARAAAAAQGLSSLEVRTGDVAEIVAELAQKKASFDAIVVNPPRRGISPVAREVIARLGASIVLYVSCDPDTLARDLDHFSRLGYTASELVPFDMIPLTDEVETVTVLRRSQLPPPRVIFEDDEVLVVEKGPHEPVEPHAEYVESLVQRAGRGAVDGVKLVPAHRLDPGTSGLCILAKSDAAAEAWSASINATGRMIYLAAVKGVTPAKGAITRDLREGSRSYPARTRYRRLAIASGHSVLRVIPDGGRTHQIRRHLAAIGHPVLGDERYGHLPTNRYFEEKHGLDRTFLHLVRVEVAHPKTGMRLLIESTLAGDLRMSLERATGSSVLRFLEQKHALGQDRASSIPPPMPDVGDSIPPPSGFPPSVRPAGIDEAVESQRVSIIPDSSRVPELDDSPRTLRRPIVDGDDD